MNRILLKLDDRLFEDNKRQKRKALEEHLSREVELLKECDPDQELKHTFHAASLSDLQKYLDA